MNITNEEYIFIQDNCWNHFMIIKSYWCNGFTRNRLEKIKNVFYKNNEFWVKSILRYNITTTSAPNGLDNFQYNHFYSNFASTIRELLYKNKILK